MIVLYEAQSSKLYIIDDEQFYNNKSLHM
jgi:hypothetical protein